MDIFNSVIMANWIHLHYHNLSITYQQFVKFHNRLSTLNSETDKCSTLVTNVIGELDSDNTSYVT